MSVVSQSVTSNPSQAGSPLISGYVTSALSSMLQSSNAGESVLNNVISILSSLSTGILSQLSANEKPMTLVTSNIRLTNQIIQSSSS